MTLDPTPQLRFVERQVSVNPVDQTYRIARILQQWWCDVQTGYGEWRDVPLGAE